jgi:hypothetical protein
MVKHNQNQQVSEFAHIPKPHRALTNSWPLHERKVALAPVDAIKSLLKNPDYAKMGQLPSPDARSPGAQRLPRAH